MGRTQEGLKGLLFPFFPFFFLPPLPPPQPTTPALTDGIKRNHESVCLSLGTFLGFSVRCYLKKDKTLKQNTVVLTQKSNSTVEISLSIPRDGFPK